MWSNRAIPRWRPLAAYCRVLGELIPCADDAEDDLAVKVQLLSLPWNDFQFPQPSLGVLLAYLQEREPTWDIEAHHAYLDIALPDPELYMAVGATDFEGERVYASLMYPECADRLVEAWEEQPLGTKLGMHLSELERRGHKVENILGDLRTRLDRHLDELVESRSWDDTVVGLTTNFSQLFGNLLLAKRLKQAADNVTVVLGGSTVSPAAIADSILATYPFVDLIVRGEGELPFHALLGRLERGETSPWPRGVVSRDASAKTGGMWQLDDLDVLPTPNFDSYFERAPSQDFTFLPVEGSRGCWWDRTTRNTKSTCYFCNLNVQWDGFRQKSGRKIAAEMRELAGRYRRMRFSFLDNIVRVKGFDEFIGALDDVGLDPFIFHEARAQMRPEDILRFTEVGLRRVQFGLEGLSNSFLKRIHKGTTVIQNLEVMKTCAELHLKSFSNLIIDFPSATQAEVAETVDVIDNYAYAYEPPAIAAFELGIDSVVARFPEQFGVSQLQNHERYATVIPERDLSRLTMFQYSYQVAELADWSPVVARVHRWEEAYRPHPLFYQDGGSFMQVCRRKPGKPLEIIELERTDTELYRFCLRIRNLGEIRDRFGFGSADRSAEIDASLNRMVEQKIMYRDRKRYLSLAAAPDPFVAAKRIRAEVRPSAERPVRKLSVVR